MIIISKHHHDEMTSAAKQPITAPTPPQHNANPTPPPHQRITPF
jgi:hypothetical protein